MMGYEKVVAGIDIGSTNIKALLLDRHGSVVGRQVCPTPRNTMDSTIDASDLVTRIGRMLDMLCGDLYRISALASAGIGEDGILVDSNLIPVTPALAWFDPRRETLFNTIEPLLAPFTEPGIRTDPFRTLTGWRWAATYPGHERGAHWIALTDFPAVFWSGHPFMSDTLAARTAAWSVRERDWQHDRVRLTLGSADLLPAIVPSGSIIGVARTEHVPACLLPDTLILAGGHDHLLGGWGIDQITPHAILDSMGTAEVVVTQLERIPCAVPADVDLAPGILSMGATALCVEELARNLKWASQNPSLGDTLGALISGQIHPNDWMHSSCFQPGGHGGHAPLFTKETPDCLLSRGSAVLGALARAGARAIEHLQTLQPAPTSIYLSGGWARATGWVNIKRQLCPTPFTLVREPELTAASAALLAAKAAGWAIDAKTLLMEA